MQRETLVRAIIEAEGFLRRAKKAKFRLEEDKYASITGSKETAACKRASMDLTRALSELRRS